MSNSKTVMDLINGTPYIIYASPDLDLLAQKYLVNSDDHDSFIAAVLKRARQANTYPEKIDTTDTQTMVDTILENINNLAYIRDLITVIWKYESGGKQYSGVITNGGAFNDLVDCYNNAIKYLNSSYRFISELEKTEEQFLDSLGL